MDTMQREAPSLIHSTARRSAGVVRVTGAGLCSGDVVRYDASAASWQRRPAAATEFRPVSRAIAHLVLTHGGALVLR